MTEEEMESVRDAYWADPRLKEAADVYTGLSNQSLISVHQRHFEAVVGVAGNIAPALAEAFENLLVSNTGAGYVLAKGDLREICHQPG